MKPHGRSAAKRKRKPSGIAKSASGGRVMVNPFRLAPICSYSDPEFLKRGYYVDKPFACKDCGREEVWTASQQRWWYEVVKGGVFTEARRCRSCRRRERERRAEARRVHLEGVAAKKSRGNPDDVQ